MGQAVETRQNCVDDHRNGLPMDPKTYVSKEHDSLDE